MTDQELDTLMRRVLLDSLKLDAESTASGELAFEPTPRYQRQMAAMVKDPLKWERRRAPVEECGAKGRCDPAGVLAQPGEPDGSQPHGAGRSGTLGHGMVRDSCGV